LPGVISDRFIGLLNSADNMEIDYKDFHQAIELFFIGDHNNQEKAVFEMYDDLQK
jgi:hypothetical protein